MLRRIGLKNFKCFETLELPCAPLNLLCGLNGMGKSSVIQALLVLRQSFEARDLLEGRLVLGGALTDLGAGSNVLFEDAEEEIIGFELRGDEAPEPWTPGGCRSGGRSRSLATRRHRATNVGFGRESAPDRRNPGLGGRPDHR